MASSIARVAPQKALEDPLAFLPCSIIAEYKKGQLIYDQDQPSTSIYLVIEGKVKVSRSSVNRLSWIFRAGPNGHLLSTTPG